MLRVYNKMNRVVDVILSEAKNLVFLFLILIVFETTRRFAKFTLSVANVLSVTMRLILLETCSVEKILSPSPPTLSLLGRGSENSSPLRGECRKSSRAFPRLLSNRLPPRDDL